MTRLDRLETGLADVREVFPDLEAEFKMCRYACGLLEAAWWERAEGAAPGDQEPCDCALCANLPVPPARTAADYNWRRSNGLPLVVQTWPYRREIDSVLTNGWVWTRKLNDSSCDLGLRQRYEDDILAFHEYKRVINTVEVDEITRSITDGLETQLSVHGARALVCGLFAAYKRRLDEYWLGRHAAGELTLDPQNPLDKASYGLLQLMDCLFWHVAPDSELWREEHLAALVLCRVVDDMTDVRADAITGEISNFWLSAMSPHDKALYAACAIATIKFGCTPEAHGSMWNSWLMPATIVWQGLTGRHALWFDGMTAPAPTPDADCLLCGLRPHSCAGLLSGTVTLGSGPRPTVSALSEQAAKLVSHCDSEAPLASPLLRSELASFEALHGPWRGRPDTVWAILSRTYIAAVTSSLTGSNGARGHAIQTDSAAVGAEQFHTLNQFPSATEDTALLAYMFGCAHPHFLWNCLGHVPAPVSGDWLDG